MTKNNYCRGLCVKPELDGVKRHFAHNKGVSMYTLGYCYCDRCQLFFNPESQRDEKNGYIRVCKCCKTSLRFKPKSSRCHSRMYDVIRDAKRY